MVNPTNHSNNFAGLCNSVKALSEHLFHLPLIDETKVQFLKKELSSGRYEVKSQSLAARIIEHVHPIQQLEIEEMF